jgi:FtsH-binding integral membrane protein
MSSDRDDPFDIPDPFAGDAMPLPPPPALPPSPARGTVRRRRALAMAVALGVECALICALGLRTMTTKVLLLGVVCPVLIAGVTLVLLLRSRVTSSRLGLTAAAASLLFFASSAAEAHAPSAPAAAAVTCMMVTAVLLAGPLLLGALALRNAFPSGAAGRATTLGVAAGLLGAATIRLHCPHDDSIHIMLGHGLPILAAGLLALAAHKILRA